jgi:hypothetical protein
MLILSIGHPHTGFAGKRSGVIWSMNAKAPVKSRIGAAWQDHEPGR